MNKIQRIEKHIVIADKDKAITNICFLSKNLYNYANYIHRQLKFGILTDIPQEILNFVEYRYDKFYNRISYSISEYDMTSVLADIKQHDYKQLPAQTSQQVIKLLYKNWKSHYKLLSEYVKGNVKNIPKPPGYKKPDGQNVVVFPSHNLRINSNGYIRFPKKTKIKPIKTLVEPNCFKQIRIVPNYGHFTIEVVYTKEVLQNENLNNNKYLSIDLGVNNLITTSNNAGLRPFIINGKIVKSINQYFNKKKAILQSYVGDRGTSKRLEKLHTKRKFKIEYSFHQASRYVIDYCVKNNIKNIVIGYNQEWKQNINIGKTNNQKFVFIPYSRLIQMIEYKAKEVGINVIRHEESYTSKCDALSCEELGFHKNYSGERVKRGLFQSSISKIINSDVNGALNILRKVIGDDFIDGLSEISPVKVVFDS